MEHTDPRTLLLDIARILDELDIPYLITGGMAVFMWGRPRFTADIDLIVELSPAKADALERMLKSLCAGGYIDRSMMEDAMRHHGEFNFIDGETGMKIDFWVSTGNAFDASRMKRRVKKEILGHDVYFSSPEDLILSKLSWYAESRTSRHAEDIKSILKVSGEALDRTYLNEWISKMGFQKIADEVGIE